MFGLLRKYRDRAKLKRAKLLLAENDETIDVSPENVLILWEGLRAARIEETILVRHFSQRQRFHMTALECLSKLEQATELAKVHVDPERVFYPPEPREYTLAGWLSDGKGRRLSYIDFLLELDAVIREHAEYMELSKEYDAEHLYEYRTEQLYYPYCDIITFLEVILRRQLQ
jgi:hypothetical protein